MDSIPWTTGTHPVYLTVTDINGCQAIDSIKVNIIGVKPYAAFTSDSVCQGNATLFIGDTSCNCGGAIIDNFQWGFGDDSTGIGQKPSHDYLYSGIFPVTMTISTNVGCFATVTKPAFVYSKPIAYFTPLIGCDGVPLYFSDKSTNAFGNLSKWQWNFGTRGNAALDTSTFENPSYTYHAVSTTDTVELIVTTQFGCKDTADKAITIREAPDVGFKYTSVCEGNPVYFTDTSTTPITNQIISWDWHFSPTDSSMFQNPVYLFNNGATYKVWLTVKAINGCSVTDTENVVVHAIPDANFVVSKACMDSPYSFIDSSSVLAPDSIVQWIWNFGILGNSTLKNPVVTFPDSVNYTISLFVQSNAGCNSSITQDIYVNPSPVAAFQPDYYYGVSPFTVTFTNSSQGATNYTWSFGDGTGTSSLFDPSYTYTYNDSFRVQLTAYNQYGCFSTDSHVLMVIPTIADIAVTAVDTNIQGNYVALSANIANYGSQRIYSMYITAEPQGGTAFTETWTDMNNPLQPGNTMTYHFIGKYSLSELQATDYICVGAQIVNEDPDNVPSNNVHCIPFKDAFIAYDPYPSPVNNQLLHIDFILPAPDNVDITMYGLKGDLIARIYSGAAPKGLNMLTINVSSLSIGIYTYRITYKDEQRILRFVKF